MVYIGKIFINYI